MWSHRASSALYSKHPVLNWELRAFGGEWLRIIMILQWRYQFLSADKDRKLSHLAIRIWRSLEFVRAFFKDDGEFDIPDRNSLVWSYSRDTVVDKYCT